MTLQGLAQCYVAALPFLDRTVFGDLFWVAVLFGGAWLVQHAPALMRRSVLAQARPDLRATSDLSRAGKSAGSSGSASRRPTVVTRPCSTWCASSAIGPSSTMSPTLTVLPS